MNTQPAIVVGLVLSILLAVLQQIAGSGIVTNTGALNLLALLITAWPTITGIVTHFFVVPVSTVQKLAPNAGVKVGL